MKERRLGVIRGVVQGVGFRPFVARLAREESVAGFVLNTGAEVHVDAEGAPEALDRFARRLNDEAPPAAQVMAAEWTSAPVVGRRAFQIDASVGATPTALPLPPDLATCAACLEELRGDGERRHAYPFTNCTECGPRFTIVKELPYDRPRTTMAAFEMCAACRAEYEAVEDRRYHAQPIACPACGPQLRLLSRTGQAIGERDDALVRAAAAIARGAIVAIKGLGGYQLVCDATSARVVSELRARKRRADKPFAVMVRDLEAARGVAFIDAVTAEALTSSAGPIVLCKKRAGQLAEGVAPRLSKVGVMLPTTPLHHLLAAACPSISLVCTSGNRSEEPIAVDDADALERLASITDLFLLHDRPIARRADDGLVHIVAGRSRVLRLGRGLGPISLPLPNGGPARLCLGAHLKNAPALSANGRIVLWPHIGDLDTPLAREAFDESVRDLCRFLAVEPAELVCDLHPDYATSLWAERSALPTRRVPHHAAHVAACLAEHDTHGQPARRNALAFAFDGYGYGEDGGAWGGEVFQIADAAVKHAGGVRPFPLPGGDAAARDGRRALAGVLVGAGLEAALGSTSGDRHDAFIALARAPGTPKTSSVGRLFDAVAAHAGVCARSTYEGQAAMELEAIAEPGGAALPFALSDAQIDLRPMVAALVRLDDPVEIASRFHATLARVVVAVASARGAELVALAGGCFQNQRLAEDSIALLENAGIEAVLPTRIPPNDGGIALGQAWLAARADPAGSGVE